MDQWREFAGTISPTWAKSRDCKKVYHDLEAADWEGRNGKPVKNWQAKAKALYEIWRREHGGQAEERANLGTVKPSLKPTAASYAAPKLAKGSIATQTKAEKSAAKALLEGLQASNQHRTN